jgi:hypothetical protein
MALPPPPPAASHADIGIEAHMAQRPLPLPLPPPPPSRSRGEVHTEAERPLRQPPPPRLRDRTGITSQLQPPLPPPRPASGTSQALPPDVLPAKPTMHLPDWMPDKDCNPTQPLLPPPAPLQNPSSAQPPNAQATRPVLNVDAIRPPSYPPPPLALQRDVAPSQTEFCQSSPAQRPIAVETAAQPGQRGNAEGDPSGQEAAAEEGAPCPSMGSLSPSALRNDSAEPGSQVRREAASKRSASTFSAAPQLTRPFPKEQIETAKPAASEPDKGTQAGVIASGPVLTAKVSTASLGNVEKKLPPALLERLRRRGVIKGNSDGSSHQQSVAADERGSIGDAASTAPVPVTAPAAGLPPRTSPLPDGWQESMDPTYNHPYWFNLSTGERSWVKPGHDLTASGSGHAGASNETDLPDAPLPAGWKSSVDSATGVTYYYNRALNLQQWTRPQPTEGEGSTSGVAAQAGGSHAGADFIASASFNGARPGFVFKMASAGVGYYRCFCAPYAAMNHFNVFVVPFETLRLCSAI